MRYVLLSYRDERQLGALPADERALLDGVSPAQDELLHNGHLLAALHLRAGPSVVTVRQWGGRVSVGAGALGERQERLAGLFLIEARDLNDAIQVAAAMPQARAGPLEIWPVQELSAPGVALRSGGAPPYVYTDKRQSGEESMDMHDDDLRRFAAQGAEPLPQSDEQGYVEHDGARIWYAAYGAGPAVILLHGGLGHSGNWGYQVPALVGGGYRAVVIDSRGHGRSTRDERPYSYELMASDVLAVMDALRIQRAALVGWSDGACTALVLAANAPSRAAGVFFFGCNMDPSGTKEVEFAPILRRCISRHQQDYARLSATPEDFDAFSDAVGLMQQTQPNYSAADLARISVPVAIVQSEHDEFIKREHAEYLARSILGAEFVLLEGVSHFAPLQRPEQFNRAMLAFLGRVLR